MPSYFYPRNVKTHMSLTNTVWLYRVKIKSAVFFGFLIAMILFFRDFGAYGTFVLHLHK